MLAFLARNWDFILFLSAMVVMNFGMHRGHGHTGQSHEGQGLAGHNHAVTAPIRDQVSHRVHVPRPRTPQPRRGGTPERDNAHRYTESESDTLRPPGDEHGPEAPAHPGHPARSSPWGAS